MGAAIETTAGDFINSVNPNAIVSVVRAQNNHRRNDEGGPTLVWHVSLSSGITYEIDRGTDRDVYFQALQKSYKDYYESL